MTIRVNATSKPQQEPKRRIGLREGRNRLRDAFWASPFLFFLANRQGDGRCHMGPYNSSTLPDGVGSAMSVASRPMLRRSARFALAFDGEYATMNARSEGRVQEQASLFAVLLRSAKKLGWIAHERTANKYRWSLRGCSDSLIRERQRLASG